MLRRRSRSEVPAVPAGVVVGTLAAVDEAVVGADGSVHLPSSGVGFEWVVGAGDRWLRGAEATPAGRSQLLVDGLPVVETALRVPGGQVVQRVWAVADGGAEVAVLEIENRAKEAVSVGLAVTASSAGYDGELGLVVDGTRVAMGRKPSRAGGADDPVAVLTGGALAEAAAFDASSGAALVWPLAHTASLRIAVVLDGEWRGTPAGLADADAVARGWRGHVDAGARVALPDPALQAAVASARATLLVRAARPHPAPLAAAIGEALGRWGHHDAALAPIEHLLDLQRLDGSFDREQPVTTAAALAAWATHVVATDDAELADRLAEPAAKAAHRLTKLKWKAAPPAWVAAAQHDAAALLDVAGQPDAAALCRERVAAPADVSTPAGPWTELPTDGAVVAGPDPGVAATLLDGVRARLVDDSVPGELRLLGAWPDEWLGADVEAHRLPTRAGVLSYAVRWHGPRPALLWELDAPSPVTIRVPGLDPTWSSSDPVGEALLGAIEPAGGLPGVVQPLAEGTPVDEAPGDGESFG